MKKLKYQFHVALYYLKSQGLKQTVSWTLWKLYGSLFKSWFFVREYSLKYNTLSEKTIEFPVSVSVIIPVNNAWTKGVQGVIETLQNQENVNLEIIAIDSGSTDSTVSNLREMGVDVYEIKPEDFTHSYSRNFGASKAKYDYLLFTVDDAYFEDSLWISTALKLMRYTKTDAISGSQSIDENASHYAVVLDEFLRSAQRKTPGISVSKNLFPRAIRDLAPLNSVFRSISIDDTNHLVKRSVFQEILFQTDTVEDIDFARRLVRNGGTVAFSNFLKIRHYHKYDETTLKKYFKRVYLDNVVINNFNNPRLELYSDTQNVNALCQVTAGMLQAVEEAFSARAIRRHLEPIYANSDPNILPIGDLLHVMEDLGRKKILTQNVSLKKITIVRNLLEECGIKLNYQPVPISSLKFWLNYSFVDLQHSMKILENKPKWSVVTNEQAEIIILHLAINRIANILTSKLQKSSIELNLSISDWE